MTRDQLHEINQRLLAISTNIRLLGPISWSFQTEKDFLSKYYEGQLVMPEVEYQKIDHSLEITELKKIESLLSENDALENFTLKTARSYRAAAEMLESIGTPHFTELSIEMFGRPDTPLLGTEFTHLSAAKELLEVASGFDHPFINEPDPSFSAEQVAEYLLYQSKRVLGPDTPQFEVTENLVAKAAASAGKVRLRAGTYYTDYDFDQLLVHEVMTHTLTAINGQAQPHLKVLSRGAPRTAMTQEGLATFSEMVSGVMNLKRLERLALRVQAIDHAFNGANFIDVFNFFIESGQPVRESYLSASRVFRGGYPDKGIIFTKDSVYLQGLLKVYHFFRWAIMQSRTDLMHLLFCGKMHIDDVFFLADAMKEGEILPPKYLPTWYQRIGSLAGTLSFTSVLNRFHVDDVDAHFQERLD